MLLCGHCKSAIPRNRAQSLLTSSLVYELNQLALSPTLRNSGARRCANQNETQHTLHPITDPHLTQPVCTLVSTFQEWQYYVPCRTRISFLCLAWMRLALFLAVGRTRIGHQRH